MSTLSSVRGRWVAYARFDWPRGVFAWQYINMVVTSRGFAFRALITQAGIWKRFGVENSTSLLYLPVPSSAEIFTNMLCQFFIRLSWHFIKARKTIFWSAFFLQNKNWLRLQDFVYKTLPLVNKELCFFSQES